MSPGAKRFGGAPTSPNKWTAKHVYEKIILVEKDWKLSDLLLRKFLHLVKEKSSILVKSHMNDISDFLA